MTFFQKQNEVFVSQVEVENFVLKMAAEFPSRRDQLIFLINNYDMMLSVLMVSVNAASSRVLSSN